MGGSGISYGHRHPSGRGYWQELIESIVWAHNKLKVAPATQPRALSIVQGRAVGVTHYLLGGIATTWAFFLARIIADPLHVRPIAHAIWDPHFGKPAVEAFTRGGALGPVNIAYSGVYQWWLATLTTEMETERFVVQKCRISSESSFVRTLRRQWNLYAQNPDSSSHLFGTSQGAGTAILTLLGDSIHKHKVYG
ncbi:Photosystem I chlorophyll a apoprotein A2 [Sesamum angolense]|uniref:Photosystem I chlorophyll a apoprotein A2 n=1 Tax=Sesamum angolense TaxID=2727404 RepID=A0AAE1VZJ3_9LAMI|nr:Photosystem I chlorophyll a apoprotein A2 [Sesamum angolense]